MDNFLARERTSEEKRVEVQGELRKICDTRGEGDEEGDNTHAEEKDFFDEFAVS